MAEGKAEEPKESAAQAPKVAKETHCFLPTDHTFGRDFYIFGPTAARKLGAEDPVQIAFFRFRADLTEDIYISVFDPDASGANDAFYFTRGSPTAFTIYGGAGALTDPGSRGLTPTAEQKGKVLASRKFHKEYDNQWYHFGPFQALDGEVIGDWSYFKVVAHALEGGVENDFRLAGFPRSGGEGFCYKMALNMQHEIGLTTKFFIEVPKGMRQIVEMNYDVDATGGQLFLDTPKRSFRLASSRSGKWIRNQIDLEPDETGVRCTYRFVKGAQRRTNMILTFVDANDQLLRLFSSEGPVDAISMPVVMVEEKPEDIPQVKDPCLAFRFDASKSFDPDNQNLTYEWDFGDDTPKSDKVRVTHVYEKPGKYTVTLTVNDGSQGNCAVGKTVQEVLANTRPIPVIKAPEALVVGQPGTFDGSESKDTPGDILTHFWNFGDGKTAQGEVVEHAYEKGGVYTVKLTVEDDKKTRCSSASIEKAVRVNTPPVADAGEDVNMNKTNVDDPFEVPLDGSKSHDADGDKLSYYWEFGDGEKGEGAKIKHVYPKGGTYTAKLTVKDNSGLPGDTATDEAKIMLNRAPTAILDLPRVGCLNDEIRFDASRSLDLDGDGLTYEWKFGDGETGEGARPKHQYKKPGAYTVQLIVDDGRGTNISRHTIQQEIRILESLVAIIKPVAPNATGQLITFEADDAQNPKDRELTYAWDLGDGEKAEGKTVNHAFQKGGEYKVRLTVADGTDLNCGRAVAEKAIRINTPPTPSLEILDKICCVNQEVKFDASKSKDPDGDGLKYLWDFGDGNTSEEVSPTYIYRKTGVFKITLTVTDSSGLPGASATATAIARVNQAPNAVMTVEGL
jgi:PKD repeat protein